MSRWNQTGTDTVSLLQTEVIHGWSTFSPKLFLVLWLLTVCACHLLWLLMVILWSVVTCNGASGFALTCNSCFRTLRMIQLYGNGDRNSARRYRAPQEKQRSALLHVTTERGNREEEANLNLLKTHIYTQVRLSQVSWWNTQFPGRICPRRCC